MAVQAYVGFHGGGKTYALAEKGRKALSEGRDVYTNFGLDGAETVCTWAEILQLRRGVLLIDEMAQLAPARGWNKFPPALTILWTQARKLGLDVAYTTQSFEFVDKYVREVTQWVTVSREIRFRHKRDADGNYLHAPLAFMRHTYHGHQYGSARARSVAFDFKRFDPEIGRSYDTMRIIDHAIHLLDEQIKQMKLAPLRERRDD